MSPNGDSGDSDLDAMPVALSTQTLKRGVVDNAVSSCVFEILLSEALASIDNASIATRVAHELQTCLLSHYPVIWQAVLTHLPDTHWLFRFHQETQQAQSHSLSLNIIDNASMLRLNQTYRNKTTSTDVLTFPALEGEEHDGELGLFAMLPELELGEIYVSVDWALDDVGEEKAISYLLERLIHGSLHILGVHHDTESAYNKVIGIQADILSKLTAL